MSDWLEGIRNVVDRAESPVRVFFRDDDAGWANDHLYRLLDRFTEYGIAIDLAVIPNSLEHALANELLARWRQNRNLLGLHQHGFSHANHEPVGRKCEFGGSRTKSQQRDDITKGKAWMATQLGHAVDPFFTPPWNRCTQETLECLEDLDFKLLSCDASATKFESSGLQQTPVHINWSRIVKTSSQPLAKLGQVISSHLVVNSLTGIMLHHVDMEEENLDILADLLAVFSGHQNVQSLLLRDTLG